MNTFDTSVLVNEIIDLYSKEFSEYYATVIAITERFPEQINNEIRNTFSHLARTRSATTMDDAKDEAKKAKGHLERACRDCLKLCIVEIRDRIKHQLDHAMTLHEAISPGIMTEYAHIQKERHDLIRAENKGVDPDLTSRFKKLLEESIALDQKVFAQYGSLSNKKLSIFMFYLLKDGRSAFKKGITAVVKWIVLSLIVAVLVYTNVPNLLHKWGLDEQWKSFSKNCPSKE